MTRREYATMVMLCIVATSETLQGGSFVDGWAAGGISACALIYVAWGLKTLHRRWSSR